MANTGPEADLDRAKQLRKLKTGVRNPAAIRGIEAAAARLEARAAKKLNRLGRKNKTKGPPKLG